MWEEQAVNRQLFVRLPASHPTTPQELNPLAHSLIHLLIECLLYVDPCYRHWGYSVSKTDQLLPTRAETCSTESSPCGTQAKQGMQTGTGMWAGD